MSDPQLTITINYRRTDSAAEVGRIYDSLVQQFGNDQVFKDVDAIPFGVDFREYLNEAVSKCSVLLAVIGKDWLTVTDEAGNRRLDDPADFVRIEIEAALKRSIPVIPILVQGASMPMSADLPPSLESLAYRNGLPVRHDPDFHRDMGRLIRGIMVACDVKSMPDTSKVELDHSVDTYPEQSQSDPVVAAPAEVVKVHKPKERKTDNVPYLGISWFTLKRLLSSLVVVVGWLVFTYLAIWIYRDYDSRVGEGFALLELVIDVFIIAITYVILRKFFPNMQRKNFGIIAIGWLAGSLLVVFLWLDVTPDDVALLSLPVYAAILGYMTYEQIRE